MDKNRSHGKIDRLPDDLRTDVEEKLLEGFTYEQISDYLKAMGHDVHYSSVHRYGKPFLKKFENVRMAKEFARLLAEDNIDRPTTELHEANNALVSQIIMEALIDEETPVEQKLDAARSIATLQRAQVQNEKLKINARKERDSIHLVMQKFKEQVFTEIGKSHPELAEAILAIADETENNMDGYVSV